MTRVTVALIAGTAVISAAAGWRVGQDHPAATPHADALIAQVAQSPEADRVQVLRDGTVSIQVRRASLDWLLAELTRQGATIPPDSSEPPVTPRSSAKPVSTAGAEANASSANAPDTVEALGALRAGDDSERVAALQQVSSGASIVPADVLQQLIDSDPSEEIRTEAYRALVTLRSTNQDALHQLLEEGLTSSSATVRAESNARLAIYDQRRGVRAANVQP